MEEVALAHTALVPGLRSLDEVSWGSPLGGDDLSPTSQLTDLSSLTHRCTQTQCGWCQWASLWPMRWTQPLRLHCRLQWSCAVGRESPLSACPGWGWILTLPWSLEPPAPGWELRLLFPLPCPSLTSSSLPLPTGTCCALGRSGTWSSLRSANSPRGPHACWPSPGSRPSRSGTPAGPRRLLRVDGAGHTAAGSGWERPAAELVPTRAPWAPLQTHLGDYSVP